MVDGRIAFGETHLFVGRGYVVSVRHGASTSYTPVRERCEAAPKALSDGEDFILYAILDFIVDNYMPVIETIQAEVEEIEDSILAETSSQDQVARLYQLRRDLLRLRNAAVPLVEVCRRLEQPGLPGIDAAMQPLFRDVSDHIRRVQEEIESLREVLAFAFETSLMTGQAQQTEITRKLAAWAAILAVPTAVAGIYGMNFERHARAALAVRLCPCAGGHRRGVRLAVLALPAKRLALTAPGLVGFRSAAGAGVPRPDRPPSRHERSGFARCHRQQGCAAMPIIPSSRSGRTPYNLNQRRRRAIPGHGPAEEADMATRRLRLALWQHRRSLRRQATVQEDAAEHLIGLAGILANVGRPETAAAPGAGSPCASGRRPSA